MIEAKIRVDGQDVRFEWHPDPVGEGGAIDAPGVVAFHADTFHAGKDTLRGLYAAAHLNDDATVA